MYIYIATIGWKPARPNSKRPCRILMGIPQTEILQHHGCKHLSAHDLTTALAQDTRLAQPQRHDHISQRIDVTSSLPKEGRDHFFPLHVESWRRKGRAWK